MAKYAIKINKNRRERSGEEGENKFSSTAFGAAGVSEITAMASCRDRTAERQRDSAQGGLPLPLHCRPTQKCNEILCVRACPVLVLVRPCAFCLSTLARRDIKMLIQNTRANCGK